MDLGDLRQSFMEKEGKGPNCTNSLVRLHKTETTKHKHGSRRTRTVRNEWRNQHKACAVATGGHSEHQM